MTVTVAPMSSDHKGETTSPEVSKSFVIEKAGMAGKSFKERRGKKSDGQNAKEKSESAKLLDHVVESTKGKKVTASAAPGDFDFEEDTPEPPKGDSMTDLSAGRKFKTTKSDKKKSKED